MLWLIGAAVVVVGALLAVQPLLNARMAGAAGHAGLRRDVLGRGELAHHAGGGAAAAAAAAGPARDRRRSRPGPGPAGIIGAGVVLTALIATPRLGAATTVMLFIAGQLACSLLIDHYGLLGVPVHPIDLRRVLGVVCLIAGVILIRWS